MKIEFENKNTLGTKIFLVIFFSFFALIGSVAFFFIARGIYQESRSFFWEAGECRIISSELTTKLSEANPFHVSISYQLIKYQSPGAVSKAIYGNLNKSYSTFKKAYSLKRAFLPEKLVPCYYDFKNPIANVLRRGNPAKFLILLFPSIFILIGFGGLFGGFVSFKPSQKSRVSSRLGPVSWKIKIIFLLLLAAGITASSYFLVIRPYANLFEAKDWKQMNALVVKSDIKESSSDDGTTYAPDVIYQYVINGVVYYSNQITFFEYSSSNYQRSSDIVNKYVVGKEISILVDSSEPLNAVIEPRVPQLQLLFGLIPLVLLLIFYAILRSFKSTSKKNSLIENGENTESAFWIPPRTLLRSNNSSNFALTPAVSRKTKFFGVSIFALIWNGGVWFMWGHARMSLTFVILILFSKS